MDERFKSRFRLHSFCENNATRLRIRTMLPARGTLTLAAMDIISFPRRPLPRSLLKDGWWLVGENSFSAKLIPFPRRGGSSGNVVPFCQRRGRSMVVKGWVS